LFDVFINIQNSVCIRRFDVYVIQLEKADINFAPLLTKKPGWRSWYTDWLRAGLPNRRSSSLGGGKNFYFPMSSIPALGSTQPHIQWVPGSLSPQVKRPGGETDHSLPTSAEDQKNWVYRSTIPYIFMA
jgi:hypothetical protein